MPIIRQIKEIDYTVINNQFLRDQTLDLECRGLLVTMLSLPDTWNFTGRGLASILPCGKTKVFRLLNKLEEAGYLKREEIRNNKGQISDTIYYVAATAMFVENPTEENSADNNGKFESDFVKKTEEFDGDFVENSDADKQEKCETHTENSAEKCVENFSNNDTNAEISQDVAEEISQKNTDNDELQNKENICVQPCPHRRDTGRRDTDSWDSNKLYNNKLNTNKLYIDQVCNNQSINQSKQDLLNYDSLNHDSVNRLTERLKDSKPIFSPKKFAEICLHHLDYEKCKSAIKQNIAYEILSVSSNMEILDEIVDIMANIVAFAKTPIKINGDKIPAEIVAERFMSLGQFDIEYVLETLNKNTTAVKNIRAYLITTLYNSKSTLNTYYQTEMQHDFYGSG